MTLYSGALSPAPAESPIGPPRNWLCSMRDRGSARAGEPVPSYAEVFRFCMASKIWMNVEIKPDAGCAELTGRVVAETTRKLFAGETSDDRLRPLFSSFSCEALLAAKSAAPEIPRGYLVERVAPDWRDRLDEIDAIALHTNQKYLALEQARGVKEAGFGLFCYTVNDPGRAREILSWGVDAFCTDRIDLIGPDFS